MTFNDVRKNENKGFSLVELIVVIAIMAVMTAVLAPSLLQYVERSRAQKDDSAMGELTNAIQLALADQDAYDECLKWNDKDAKTSYYDENGHVAAKVDADAKGNFTYKAEARIKDEKNYSLGGKMRGLNITFFPVGNKMVLANGFVNLHGTAASRDDSRNFANMHLKGVTGTDNDQKGVLYNKVRAAIGNEIELTSQTYRNSTYTVFIKMGSLGGKDFSKMDAIKVYGQWGGTNIPNAELATSANGKIVAGAAAAPTT